MKKALLTLALLASTYACAGITLNISTVSKNGEQNGVVTLEDNQAVLVMSDDNQSIEIEATKKDNAVTVRCVICQILQGQSQVVAQEEQTVTADEPAKFKCSCASDEQLIVVVSLEEEAVQESDAQ
jgi:hypothetical protein